MGATAAAEGGLSVPVAALAQTAGATGLRYSDGSAAARTVIVLQGNAAALQHRLPSGWDAGLVNGRRPEFAPVLGGKSEHRALLPGGPGVQHRAQRALKINRVSDP